MTSEVAILNKTGVALATDSAVTISSSTGEVAKIYVDANKLFELVKGSPVGIMIYNGAEIDGYPWETLIKIYRSTGPGPRSELCDYLDDFLEFTSVYLQGAETTEQQTERLQELVSNVMNWFVRLAAGEAGNITGKLAQRSFFRDIISGTLENLRAEPMQDWASGIDVDDLWKRHRAALVKLAPKRFLKSSLTLDCRTLLAEAALLRLLQSDDIPGSASGLVVSGFGESEPFPSLEHRYIGGLIEGRLMVVGQRTQAVSHSQPGIISPFAQTGEANMFLHGINPDISQGISTFWRQWAEGISVNAKSMAKDVMGIKDSAALDDFGLALDKYMATSWSAFSTFMDEQFHRERMEPIEISAAFLSKREIAELAENLVDLTSLRDRVSIDRQETVGGATDVAVISKGDGFVWIKRKHYFDREKNPSWALRQVVQGVVSDAQGRPSEEGVDDA